MKATMIFSALAAMLALMPAAQASQPSCSRPNAERPLPTPDVVIALVAAQAVQNPGSRCERPNPTRPNMPGTIVVA